MIISYDTSPDESGNYPFGTVATISCVSGFGLSGSGASSSTCGADGSSSVGVFPVSPTCECEHAHTISSVRMYTDEFNVQLGLALSTVFLLTCQILPICLVEGG